MWHANPEKYKPDDEINTWGGLMKASEIWEKDKIKKDHIESFGYKVIYFWENDLRKNKEKAYERILNEINQN